jgi:hypothetical protein
METRRAEHAPVPSPAFLRVVAAVLIAAPVLYGALGGYRTARPEDEVRSAAFLGRVAAMVSVMFPRKVDAETEITGIAALEGVLVYHYRFFNFAAADPDSRLIAGIRPSVTRTTCANAVTRANFLKKDVILRFHYADKGGRALTSFDVTLADCGV